MGRPVEDINDRFFKRVKKTKGCWLWIGSVSKSGYGLFTIYRTNYSAHRMSWMIHNGSIKTNKWILHRCDNKLCVNPSHLFIGSPKENTQDMIKKKRNNPPIGERNGKSILSSKQVLKIKSLLNKGLLQREIARIFGVSKSCINSISNGYNWRHI